MWLRVFPLLLFTACALDGGCNVQYGTHDFAGPGGDAGITGDLRAVDLAPAADQSRAVPDSAAPAVDLTGAGPLDMNGRPSDLASEPPDLSATLPDLATRPPDLSSGQTLCTRGPGFVAWRFHYSAANGTNPVTDVFGLPDRSNWQVFPAYPTMLEDLLNGGGIDISTSNWLIIRYSVMGVSHINGATLSVFGRSYDTTASGSFLARTPLHGDIGSATDTVSNAWPYTWTSIDFSGYVQVGDTPGLTGIRLYGGASSDSIVVHTIELCINGS